MVKGYKGGTSLDAQERDAEVFVYVMACEQYCKVGISRDPARRATTMLSSNPFPVRVLLAVAFTAETAPIIEARVHQMLHPSRHLGEWFRCDTSLATEALRTAALERRPYPPWAGPQAIKHPASALAHATLRRRGAELERLAAETPSGAAARILAALRALTMPVRSIGNPEAQRPGP